MCDCIKRIEKQLNEKMNEKYNSDEYECVEPVKLDSQALMFPKNKPSYYALYSEAEGKVRKGKCNRKFSVNMSFKYCPFCGEPYEKKSE